MKQEASVQEFRQEIEHIKKQVEKFAVAVGFAIGFLGSLLFMALLNKA